MRISSRFTIAVHMLIAMEYFKGQYKITSEFLASSVCTNPVVIRRLLGKLKEANLIKVSRGTGGAVLTRDATLITLYDIYQAVEEDDADGALFNFHEHPEPLCPVGSCIHEVLDPKLDSIKLALINEMKATTLAELVNKAQTINLAKSNSN